VVQPEDIDLHDDPGLTAVLEHLGATASTPLGRGGEATVFVLDDDRVVRVLHHGGQPGTIASRQSLVDELASKGAPFALPRVIEAGHVGDRWYAVEQRWPGQPVARQLARLEGADRDLLVEHHLEAAAGLGDLALVPRGWWGELIAEVPVRSAGWEDFLARRAEVSLASVAGSDWPELGVAGVEPLAARLAAGLAAALAAAPESPGPPRPIGSGSGAGAGAARFVHLDAFAGNMLAVGPDITAVVDFGATSVAGDRRLDPLASAVYLAAADITPTASRRDVDVAMSWLGATGLQGCYRPSRRWLAAYWSFATDDVNLQRWCRSVLLG
jgi:hypothetical protein